ncbi:MAG: DUF3667 domain-containing protein, partial [Chitinophagaceae bacterium]
MSHILERKEKDCLNCGTIVQGLYCQNCGQQNVIPKETFWHMVTHFFYDITHFDGSFFSTVHHLILKPGFLSQQYMIGRRACYVHPIRMYVFSSAIFFLLFFSLFKPDTVITRTVDTPLEGKERIDYIKGLNKKLANDTGNSKIKAALLIAKDTSKKLTVGDLLNEQSPNNNFNVTGKKYKNFEEYDSLEKTLLTSNRDGWVMRRLVKKEIEIAKKYQKNPEEAIKKFSESVLHLLPYMLFVSLPLFALLLKLVYFRSKQFYYADHGVFTIHLYVFTFLLLMAVFGLSKLEEITKWGFINLLTGILFIILFFYLYKAMRKFYGQKRGKTFLKFLLISI